MNRRAETYFFQLRREHRTTRHHCLLIVGSQSVRMSGLSSLYKMIRARRHVTDSSHQHFLGALRAYSHAYAAPVTRPDRAVLRTILIVRKLRMNRKTENASQGILNKFSVDNICAMWIACKGHKFCIADDRGHSYHAQWIGRSTQTVSNQPDFNRVDQACFHFTVDYSTPSFARWSLIPRDIGNSKHIRRVWI